MEGTPKSIGRARLRGKTSRPRRGGCPHPPGRFGARAVGLYISSYRSRPSGPGAMWASPPTHFVRFCHWTQPGLICQGSPPHPSRAPPGPPSEGTEGFFLSPWLVRYTQKRPGNERFRGKFRLAVPESVPGDDKRQGLKAFSPNRPGRFGVVSRRRTNPPPSPAWRGCRPQAAGVEGTPKSIGRARLSGKSPLRISAGFAI